MTFLAKRHPARVNTDVVRVQAITRVDRNYQVQVYGNMSLLWNNLERITLYFDRYGDELMTKDSLRHRLETEGTVRVYEREARSNGEWYWQFELHK